MGNNLGNEKMKEKRLLTTLFCAGALACALVMTSCGGGGGTEGGKTEAKFKKQPKNEFLGDLVNIAGEYEAKWDASEAEYKEARKKNNEKYADNSDKREQNYGKISASHKERGKQIVADANAALEKEMATLNGKALPFVFEEGLGFEVVECKITGITKHASSCNRTTLTFTYKVRATDEDLVKKISVHDYPIKYGFVDANGNALLDKKGNAITEIGGFSNEHLKQLRNGETVEKEGWFVLEPSFANFAKIKFERNRY
ncbi:MAG: hypothetical protein IJP44_07790 [Bacteroidales bacterium]|nr:hypothetical protein [Bacteroidales bacterium]